MKREKYIQLKHNKKGEIFFRIYIPYKYNNDNKRRFFSKNIKVKDYESEKVALSVACQLRNKALVDIQLNKNMSKYPNIATLWNNYNNYIQQSKITYNKKFRLFRDGIKLYENYTIDKITAGDIQKSINQYISNHSYEQTKRLLWLWRDMFKITTMQGYVITDLTPSVKIPKSKAVINNKKKVTFTMEEFNSIYNALSTYGNTNNIKYLSLQLQYIMIIMLYTGMRPAEVLALTKSDINLIDNNININKCVGVDYQGQFTIIPTKTKLSTRIIPISSKLKPALEKLINNTETEILFLNLDGTYIQIDKISSIIRKIAKAQNIQFSLYSIRHQFATNLINKGVDPKTIQELMGHAKFDMSLYYAQSSDNNKKKAIENLF